MVKFTIEEIRGLMDYKHNIRNMSGARTARASLVSRVLRCLLAAGIARLVPTLTRVVCGALQYLVIAHVDHGERPRCHRSLFPTVCAGLPLSRAVCVAYYCMSLSGGARQTRMPTYAQPAAFACRQVDADRLAGGCGGDYRHGHGARALCARSAAGARPLERVAPIRGVLLGHLLPLAAPGCFAADA